MTPADQVVPIESLFFSDAGPHIISAGHGAAARGSALHSLLASGIAGLDGLGSEPFSAPVEVDDTVPIEQLLYRGRAALDRAIELRNDVRRRSNAPTSEEVDELFALLDLAVAE